jgi:hypothetical protein
MIRDVVGRILGYRETRSDGKVYLLNPVKRVLGYYDPRTNQTWQIYPTRVLISREGDILATLLSSDTYA